MDYYLVLPATLDQSGTGYFIPTGIHLQVHGIYILSCEAANRCISASTVILVVQVRTVELWFVEAKVNFVVNCT